MPKKLNVGCGPDIRPAADGWVNMDIVALPGVDVVHNIVDFPWPFEPESFDHMVLNHVLEHVPHHLGHESGKDGFVLLMEEMHRVLRPGGTIEIFSPHPESEARWADPTHTRVVHPRNFDYFSADSHYNYYTSARFHIRAREVSRRSAILPHFMPIGKKRLGIFEHIGQRVPGMKRLVYARPWELRVLLEKA